jgi:hypothetical protein
MARFLNYFQNKRSMQAENALTQKFTKILEKWALFWYHTVEYLPFAG